MHHDVLHALDRLRRGKDLPRHLPGRFGVDGTAQPHVDQMHSTIFVSRPAHAAGLWCPKPAKATTGHIRTHFGHWSNGAVCTV